MAKPFTFLGALSSILACSAATAGGTTAFVVTQQTADPVRVYSVQSATITNQFSSTAGVTLDFDVDGTLNGNLCPGDHLVADITALPHQNGAVMESVGFRSIVLNSDRIEVGTHACPLFSVVSPFTAEFELTASVASQPQTWVYQFPIYGKSSPTVVTVTLSPQGTWSVTVAS